MKFVIVLKYFVLLGALCFVGCSGPSGSTGDSNDPAVSGSDAEQMNEQTGDVETSNSE